MATASKPPPATAICGYDAHNILIRGKNLVSDLMGKCSFTEMFLLQALGRSPTEMQCRIVDAVLVTIMEHGLVPSAIAARLTLHGAPESLQGAVAAGLLGVGDRYAGTAGECGALLERILAAPEAERQARAMEEIDACRQRRHPVPGFGHPIHRAGDPRVGKLLEIAEEAGAQGAYIGAMRLVEAGIQMALGKPLVANVSAAIAAVLGEAGVPAPLMRGVVLIARCAGLVGHLFEEMNSPVAHDMWIAAQASVEYRP